MSSLAKIAPEKIAPEAPPAESIDYKSIALLSAAHLTDDVNQGVVPAMLPFFIASDHLTYAAAAGLILAQTLSSSVVQPLFGMLADRRPSPWLIPVGLSFAGIGVALAGIAPTYALIFAAIALSGFGISAFHPEAARRVRYLSGSRQASTMSLFTVGGMAGFALGPLMITPILIAFGTHGAIVLALPVIIMAFAVTFQMPRLAAAHAISSNRTSARSLVDEPEQWGDFIRLTVVVILRSMVFFGLNTFIPLYWNHVLGGSRKGGGFALTTLLTAVTIGTLAGGHMADRYGRKIVITVSLAVLTPLMLVFLGLHSFAAASLLLVAVGLALSASNSVVVVMAQEFLPNRVGFAAGVTLGLSMTIGGLMMPLFGSIADHHGLTPTLFLLSIVPALSCALSLTLHEPGTNPPATS
ncbi:MAG: transporter, family, fosmidomycin resistance protein [Candidatus Binataceae bacterium]|jgi:FSR family fosmidomycin resistance protein-like MFS transporter|nr:transporter, family, fosmidomycin resistance protein [Candidatus Binataceae bacterium]